MKEIESRGLRLFVYGTLKRGYPAHDRLCRPVLEAEEATLDGRLFLHPAGYPVLQVPDRAVLAVGGTDVLADVARHDERFPADARDAEPANAAAGWDRVAGELLTLGDPLRSLPAIDDFEDFHPREASFYRRSLITVRGRAITTAWAYVAASELAVAGLPRLAEANWPPRRARG